MLVLIFYRLVKFEFILTLCRMRICYVYFLIEGVCPEEPDFRLDKLKCFNLPLFSISKKEIQYYLFIKALFSSKKFCKINTVAFSFVFDKYCPMD